MGQDTPDRTFSVPTDTSGRFQRADASFRDWIGDARFPAAAGRYHLVLAHACPWCHRTLLVRMLKGLTEAVSVSFVHPLMGPRGWHFDPETHPEPLYGYTHARQFYDHADPDYPGRITVPILWDTEQRTLVSNESSEIIRMFNDRFQDFAAAPELDLYPKPLRAEIDAVNERVYHSVNNGVYKCGFARTQGAYEEAFGALFDTLDWLEARLEGRHWLVGDHMTEADWRLFVTLIRFDAVYVGHFKCNLRRIADYPNLQAYTERLYRWPGVADHTDLTEIKNHYYGSHTSINPSGIVPVGPALPYLRSTTMFATLTILALTGCIEDVGKDKVKAVVENVEPVAKDPAPAAGTMWAVDHSKSSVAALGAKITAKHPIVFKDFEGTIGVEGDSVTAVNYTVQMATLESDHPKLTSHLKTEDFFDVPNHPTATFESTKVVSGSDVEGMTHTVTGNLTIRGTAKQLTFPAKIERTGDQVTASSEFTIDRQDFHVTYPGKPDDAVQDNVVLTISFVAAKPAA